MIFQIPIGRATRMVWRPRYLPDPGVAVTATLTANAVSVNTALASIGSFPITSVPDRHRLRSVGVGGGSAAVLAGAVGDGGGEWWFYAAGVGAYAVRVSHYDDANEDFVLAEPLNAGLPTTATGTIHHTTYTGTVASGALGAVVDRSGVWRVDWQTDPDDALNAVVGGVYTDRGSLRVVRAIFDTGLTSAQLTTLVPVLAQTRPAGRGSWQPLIDDMAVAVISEIEHRLPDTGFADATLGSQWQRAAALLAATHIAETGYAPGANAESLRAAAMEEFDRQAARVVWLDLDDDGVIDGGEVGVDSASLVGIMRSSGATTEASYSSGLRHRYTLDNPDDR